MKGLNHLTRNKSKNRHWLKLMSKIMMKKVIVRKWWSKNKNANKRRECGAGIATDEVDKCHCVKS